VDEFVRPAGAPDEAVLVALETEARAGVAAMDRGGRQWLDEHPCLGPTGWAVRLEDPGWASVVSGLDGVVLGYGSMRRPGGRRLAVASIEAIFVTPEGRELGLGEAMLAQLTADAAEHGAAEVEATALPGDRDTKNLFERAGLVARLIVVSRRLEP
jgi:GNAT superfamily N-acetyltransferase